MANTPNTNTTGSTAGATGLNKSFFDRDLLNYAKTKFVYANYGMKKPIPKNNGKKIEMRRWCLFDPDDAMTPLTEGTTPDGLSLEQDIVEAVVSQYGAYFTYSDFLALTTYDEVTQSGIKRLGELMGTVVDRLVRDELVTCDNVMYAAGKASRAALTKTDVLSISDIQKAALELTLQKAPRFSRGGKEHYIAIVHPYAKYDLWNDPKWEAANTYVNQEALYSGELGRMYGVVFVESTEAPVINDTVPVYQTVVFGDEAYGLIDVGTHGIESIIKPIGEAGFDPLNQRGTVGAKVKAFACKILNEDWILRIEHAASN